MTSGGESPLNGERGVSGGLVGGLSSSSGGVGSLCSAPLFISLNDGIGGGVGRLKSTGEVGGEDRFWSGSEGLSSHVLYFFNSI